MTQAMTRAFHVCVVIAVVAGVAGVTDQVEAQRGAAPPAPVRTPRAAAPVDLTGNWVSIVTQDWRFRMVTPAKGDYQGVQMTPAARKVADSWDPASDEAAGEQCKSYGAPALMAVPGRLRISWQGDTTLKVDTDAGQQTRLLYFDASKAPTTASPQGRSVAQWESPARGRGGPGGGGPGGGRGGPPPPPTAQPFGTLKVTTTNLTPGWLRRNGAPYSEQATVDEYFDNIDSTNQDKWLIVTTTVRDPKFLNADYITSSHFKREAPAEGPRPKNWLSTPCKPAA